MNEKGFAATSILYTILVVFVLIMFSMISLLYSRNNLLNKIQTNIKDNIQDILQQYQVYENGSVVYFNPETATVCSPANAVSTTGTKTGCMKWYIFNDHSSNGYVNLLLDHNTTAAVAWNSSGVSTDGMKEVKKALDEDIPTWDNDVKLTARLITADEIAMMTDATNQLAWKASKNVASPPDLSTTISWFYLDGKFGSDVTWHTQVSKTQGASQYAWLYNYTNDCTSYGCNSADSSNYGYWTSTFVTGKYDIAWFVSKKGALDYHNVSNSIHYGVRPVIQVNKKNIVVNPTNLVVNGDLALKNNTNFTNFKYDEDEFGGYLSYSGNSTFTITSDEYIAVDSTKKYTLSMDLKANNSTSSHYAGIIEYDIDKNIIVSDHVMYMGLTSLKQDLKDGDTVVYLNDASQFAVNESTPSYQLGFIIWNYKDSTGYTYPSKTYSRNVYRDIFVYGSVDVVNNTITLKKPWSYGLVSKGTELSQCNGHNLYNYSLLSGLALPNLWNSYTADIAGINSYSYVRDNVFRAGVRYVKPFIMFNYNNVANTTLYAKNISLTVTD